MGLQWPPSLPHLRVISNPKAWVSGDLAGGIPDEWQNYTNLEQITLRSWQIGEIPDWFRGLGKLQRVVIPNAECDVFDPAPLLLLPDILFMLA